MSVASLFSHLLAPFEYAVSAVLAAGHRSLTAIGADPASGMTWLGAVVLLVVAVRVLLTPLVLRQVRIAHASARAQPELARIRERYRGRTDLEDLRRQREEVRAVQAEHGLGALAMAPLLVQLPVMLALFHVLRDVGAGLSVGAMGTALVASATVAPILRIAGADLGTTLLAAGTGPAGVLVATLAAAAAIVTYLTSRYLVLANMPAHSLEGPVGAVQHLIPPLSAAGLLVGATVVPLGVIVYWLVGAIWTAGQQWAINRWAPTPGSAAFTARRPAAG